MNSAICWYRFFKRSLICTEHQRALLFKFFYGGNLPSHCSWRLLIILCVSGTWSRTENPTVKRLLFKLKLVVFTKINKTTTKLFENWYRTYTFFMENRTFVSCLEKYLLRTNYFLQSLISLLIIHNVSKDRSGKSCHLLIVRLVNISVSAYF